MLAAIVQAILLAPLFWVMPNLIQGRRCR